uniref:Sodium/calcium exchanger membrane region domain-containing protein n=1 Tax=Musa acuminata subsp. malaccensis TaxID=214687 RepID=A0A804L679_MUSAM
MYKAATYLSSGSELLLEIMGPGIIGGLFLPILGALPDAMLILVSGLSGSRETAQNQVLIGMGLLAGSTVMLLTVLWGSCVIVGKCDLSEDSTSIYSQDTKAFSLFGQFLSQLFSAVCGFCSMVEVLFLLFLGKILTGSTSQIPRVLIKCTDLNNSPRIGRYGVISSGNCRNFDCYRPIQLNNGRFRPLPLGNNQNRPLPHCNSAIVLQRSYNSITVDFDRYRSVTVEIDHQFHDWVQQTYHIDMQMYRIEDLDPPPVEACVPLGTPRHIARYTIPYRTEPTLKHRYDTVLHILL